MLGHLECSISHFYLDFLPNMLGVGMSSLISDEFFICPFEGFISGKKTHILDSFFPLAKALK